MTRAIVTELVVAVLVAMLAVDAIGAFSSSNPKPLQSVKVGRRWMNSLRVAATV